MHGVGHGSGDQFVSDFGSLYGQWAKIAKLEGHNCEFKCVHEDVFLELTGGCSGDNDR